MTAPRLPFVVPLVLALAAAAGGCGSDSSASARTPVGCVLADVSGSTREARREYLGDFARFARSVADGGADEICLVVAAGDPLAEGAPMFAPVGPSPEHRDSPDFAPGEIRANVDAATADVGALLDKPPVRDGGSALVEAAVVAADVLEPGDRLLMLTDGIQFSPAAGDFHDVDLSAAGITTLLDKLEQNDLLADLEGVEIEIPLLLFHPGGLDMDAEQQVGIREFWTAWASRTGGELVPRDRGDD